MARLFIPVTLQAGIVLDLPDRAARHAQVLRLQPGMGLAVFDGHSDGEFDAVVERMGRSSVTVRLGDWRAADREAGRPVHLALGMPSNDRMDALVEKATELGVASIQPLMTERSTLRLAGERAERRREHWQGIAQSACEQCGRNRIPQIHPVRVLSSWIGDLPADAQLRAVRQRYLLSPRAAQGTAPAIGREATLLLSGPEGGLSPAEEDAAKTAEFEPVSLGPRTLRADTAPVAILAALTLFR